MADGNAFCPLMSDAENRVDCDLENCKLKFKFTSGADALKMQPICGLQGIGGINESLPLALLRLENQLKDMDKKLFEMQKILEEKSRE